MVQDHLPLAGKVALVTGGSRCMGAAIVRRLTRDSAQRRLQLLVVQGQRSCGSMALLTASMRLNLVK